MLLLIQSCCEGFWAWPWPLVGAFLLGLLLGWLLSKIFGSKDTELQDKCDGLQAELDACRSNAKLLAANAANSITATKPKKVAAKPKAAAKKPAKKAAATKSKKDKLTKVEGIGPKIEGLLNKDGIYSFEDLGAATVKRLQKILDDAGPRYRVHNPGSWPKQAKMAAKGDWDKLKKWQDEHKGGRE